MRFRLTPTAGRHACVAGAIALATTLLAAGCSGSSGSSTGASTGSSAAPSAEVSVASSALIKSGTLTFCADISAPPLTYFDASQKPVGAEIELGDALAAALGLKSNWANTAFAGIIPALQAKQCDAILSQLYIKPEREKVVDFVPYMYASNTIVVKASDDRGITDSGQSLCGKKVAGQTGTTVISHLQDESATCTSAGKGKIDIRQFGKDSEALQQLKLGLVDAYGTTLETAAYAAQQQAGLFKIVGDPFNKVKTGIATSKTNTQLHDALTRALAAIEKNGSYAAILKRWNLSGDDITST
jgi:polar amino acid transport system substrate-binding protein